MEVKNYMKLDRWSVGYKFYCFVDTDEHLANQLFIKHNVTVILQQEFEKESTCYRFIFCKVHRFAEADFLLALDELKDKMLHAGHIDYQHFCKNVTEMLDFPRYA